MLWLNEEDENHLLNHCSIINNDNDDNNHDVGYAIPKTLHFVWLGSDLPLHLELLIEKWSEIHHDWEIHIWGDDDVVSIENEMMNSYVYHEKINNFGGKSDILRYHLLYKYGGVYIDTDYECLMRLDDSLYLKNKLCDESGEKWCKYNFFVGLACDDSNKIEINNGIIGSTPAHPLIYYMNKSIQEHYCEIPVNRPAQQFLSLTTNLFDSFLPTQEIEKLQTINNNAAAMETIRNTGPGLLTSCLSNYIKKENVQNNNLCKNLGILPKKVFHAIPNNESVSLGTDKLSLNKRNQLKEKYVDVNTSIAVHWWQRTWQKVESFKQSSRVTIKTPPATADVANTEDVS